MSEDYDLRIASRIREIFEENVIRRLEKGQIPEFEIPARTEDNIMLKDGVLSLGDKKLRRGIDNVKELRPFMQLSAVAETIYSALRSHRHPTIRDIYYHVKHTIPGTQTLTFEEQAESDAMIEDLELLTGYTREEMGIVAETRGQIAGNIVMEAIIRGRLKTVRVSDLPIPGSIPPLMDRITIKSVEAEYVLVVEKGAVFSTLYEEGYWEKNNCLLVTASGQPDRATRRFLVRMEREFKLPIYILADSDPYGFKIYSVYKFGSRGLAYESEKLAAKTAKFIGVTPSDIYNYNIPDEAIIKATASDIKYVEHLKKIPVFQTKEWQKELELFLEKKEKVEIEAFSKHGFEFLSEKYLPDKIGGGKFL